MEIEKLKLVNSLTNCIRSIDDVKIKDDIAYLMHCIIDAKTITDEIYNQVAVYKIESNKDLFINV